MGRRKELYLKLIASTYLLSHSRYAIPRHLDNYRNGHGIQCGANRVTNC